MRFIAARAAGAPPQTPLEEFTTFAEHLVGWGGRGKPSPRPYLLGGTAPWS